MPVARVTILINSVNVRKVITLNIVDGEEYEKNKNFFIELGTPRVSSQDVEFYDIVS